MKKIMLLLFLMSYLIIQSDDMTIEAVAEEASISFENEEFSAKGGLKAQYEDVKIQANKIKKVKDKNIIIAYDKILFSQQDQNVEAEELRLRLDDKTAIIKDGKSYTKVSGTAQAPHDRLYYGGEKFEARFPNKAIVRNGYFSTCSHILEGKDKADYRLESKKIVVYVGKRVVAYNTFLYIKKIPVLWFPVYVTSLKSSVDGAPLFPRFGADKDGSYVIWGLDYGEEDSKYLNGSAAVKWSTKKGWVLDSWNNAYTIEKGKNAGMTSFKDTYLWPKSGYDKEWKFTHTHNYSNSWGKLDWEYQNNSTSSLNDDTKKYLSDKGQTEEKKVSIYKLKSNFNKVPTLFPPFAINFLNNYYKDFESFAKNGEYNIMTNVEWTDQEDVMREIGNKQDEDGEEEVVGYSKPDRKILLEGKLDKREKNDRYEYSLYYKRLKDLNPGNTVSDNASYDKTQKYSFNLKKYKINLGYDVTDKDEYRVLNTIEKEALRRVERDPITNEIIETTSGDAIYINPKYKDVETVKRYDIIKNETYRLDIGSYEIFKTGIKWNVGFNKTESAKKLNADTYIDAEGQVKYFNDFDKPNVEIESGGNETKYNFGLSYLKNNLTLSYSDVETYSKKNAEQEGKPEVIVSESYEQYGAKLSNRDIDLKILGKLGLTYDYSKDIFKEKDERDKNHYDISWSKDLYDNTGDPDSSFDLKLNNQSGYKHTVYSYDLGKREEGPADKKQTKEDYMKERLNSSYRMQKNYTDTLTLGIGNTSTVYNFSLSEAYNGYYYELKDLELLESKSLNNSITFNIDNKKYFYVGVSNSDNYNERDPKKSAFKNNDSDTYTYELNDEKFGKFTYTNKKIISQTEKVSTTDSSITYRSAKDDSKVDSYGYSYKSWSINYTNSDSLGKKYDINGNELENTELDKTMKTEKNTKTMVLNFNHGELINRNINFTYEIYDDKIQNINDKNTLKINLTYTDKRDEVNEEIEKIKEKYVDEENKDKFVLSEAERQKIIEMLMAEKQNDLNFDLKGIMEQASSDTNTKLGKLKEYKFQLELTNYEDYRKKHDYGSSVSNIVAGGSMRYHQFFFSYKYTQSKDPYYKKSPTNQVEGSHYTQRLHYNEGEYSFGKDNDWKIKYNLTFDDSIKDKKKLDSPQNKKLKKYNIELEKHFHCTMLGLTYGQELVNDGDTIYESLWTFKFGLLTFPEKKLGLQRTRSEGEYTIEKYLGM